MGSHLISYGCLLPLAWEFCSLHAWQALPQAAAAGQCPLIVLPSWRVGGQAPLRKWARRAAPSKPRGPKPSWPAGL
ncbi:unnamed protein product [Caretta caretta]